MRLDSLTGFQGSPAVGGGRSACELVAEDGNRFRVNGALYTNSAIFALEMERIFGSVWVFVCHEAMVPHPGDYLTANLGGRPVIVSRDENGRVHVLLNRCAHRGSVVCREERGHANIFRCPYHGWVFSNDGKLIGAAQRSGYPDDFSDWGLNLSEVPKVDAYRGLIFASFDPDVLPLEERLGSVRRYIDLWVERSPAAAVTLPIGIHRYEFPGNWKFQAENGVDGYHGNYVHESFVNILERSGERGTGDTTKARNSVGDRNLAKGLSFGDGLLERVDGMLGTFDYRKHQSYVAQLEQAYGRERAEEILMQRNIFIFPNLFLFESHIRVIQPVSVDRTYIYVHPTYLEGVDEDLNRLRLREHERFFGPSGFGAPDDIEIFVCSQAGLTTSPSPWLEFSRGMHREYVTDEGETVAHSTDETPQRSIYRQWIRLMSDAMY